MSSPEKPNNQKKDRTKIVNARVSETLLKALAMANNNSNKFSLTEIITIALEAQLTEIEQSTDIDFIKLVKWEKKIICNAHDTELFRARSFRKKYP